MKTTSPPPVRVLFLAWGYSIHARRRIEIFTADPAFAVVVVSTHDYAFPGAENILLSAEKSFFGRVLGSLRYRSGNLLFFRLLEDLWRSFFSLLQLRNVVKRFVPEVIFLQTLLYPCYLALLLPKSIPMIVTFWNGDVTWWAQWDGIERLAKKAIVTRGARRAAAITVNSEAAGVACRAYGAEEEKIHLIRYPGVDMELFAPGDKSAARRKLGFAGNQVVLAPRGLGGYLNSEVIVAAAGLVARVLPGVLFVFSTAVARPGATEKHLRQAQELGIADNCLWLPKMAWEEMPDYYNAASLMVSISANDSLPNCMLEAMACGVPVIMGDIPQLREWVVDGENGLLVPVTDVERLATAIIALLENEKQIVDTLVPNGLALIAAQADSRKTIPRIKQLVVETAKAAGHV